MWWQNYSAAPWTFFAQTTMVVWAVTFILGAFFMVRMRPMRRVGGEFSCDNFIASPGPLCQPINARQSDGRTATFEDHRSETLRRVDQEEREFRELMAHLRRAKDKLEFGQLVVQPRHRLESPRHYRHAKSTRSLRTSVL
jgi:hypothetical protein